MLYTRSRNTLVLTICLLPIALAGCPLGPTALKISRSRYNEAIQQTSAEQLLLNLVRLRYREAPVFLEVSSVSAQFVFDQSGSISGSLNENIGAQRGNPGSLGLGASAGYTERPTISYSVLSGDDFVQRMLSPISIETVVLLTQSGWSVDRVMRLTVQELNALDNARSASGPTPALAPDAARFTRAVALLRELQKTRQAYLEYDLRSGEVSDAIGADLITADALVRAAAAGCRFRKTADGTGFVLTKKMPKLILRMSPDAADSPEASELRELLGLAADRSQYDLVLARKTKGGSLDEQGLRLDLAFDARSLLGVMFYLSQAVVVPESHGRKGLVTTTVTADGRPFDWSELHSEMFTVHSAELPPAHAAVSVHHRGHWFYIADDDQTSKSTFTLLDQLFTLQAGGGKSVAPVLTLPIGG